MLLSAEQVLKPEDLVASYEGQAFDGIQLLSADEYSLREKNLCITYGETAPEASENGIVPYGIYPVEEGTALMAYPRSVYGVFPLQGYTMRFLPDSRVFIPLFDETQTGRSLEERATDTTRPGVSLTVTQITVNDCYISGNFFANRLDGEYLILNPADFKKVTGIDSEANAKLGIATPAVSLSEIGSYLCGGAGRAGQESVYHAPMYAGNGFDVTVGDEAARARYGLPGDAVLPAAPGEVTLLLRPTSDLSPELGQIQLSGITVLGDVDLTSPEGFALTDTELLQKAINELPQYYQGYRVCSVIVTDRVEADTLLMQEDDLAALFGRNGAYTELRVSVMPDMNIEGVCSLLTSLYGWAEATPVGGSHPTLTQNGELWDALIITGFRYNQLLRAIALLLFLAVPFVWFCQQYNHYRKRKSDLEILLSLGQTRAMLRRVFLWEGLLLALFSALAVLIACPLLTLAAYGVLAFNGFPFDYSSFDFISLFAAVAFSVLCAMLSALLNDRILFPPRKQSKKPEAPSASGTALPEQV